MATLKFGEKRKLEEYLAVSDRALIVRAPMLGSEDQDGIRPHRIREARSVGPLESRRITGTGCVGATFHRGSQSMSAKSAPKCSASTSLRRESLYRPHMTPDSSLSCSPMASTRFFTEN
jgi:hypothetical protein